MPLAWVSQLQQSHMASVPALLTAAELALSLIHGDAMLHAYKQLLLPSHTGHANVSVCATAVRPQALLSYDTYVLCCVQIANCTQCAACIQAASEMWGTMLVAVLLCSPDGHHKVSHCRFGPHMAKICMHPAGKKQV